MRLSFKTLRPFTKNVQQNHTFLVTDTTLASYNSLRFKKNILERI